MTIQFREDLSDYPIIQRFQFEVILDDSEICYSAIPGESFQSLQVGLFVSWLNIVNKAAFFAASSAIFSLSSALPIIITSPSLGHNSSTSVLRNSCSFLSESRLLAGITNLSSLK